MHSPRLVPTLLIAAVAALAAPSAHATAVDFKGKTITVVIGFGAGGGYDAYARLMADHLGKHLPGNPTVIVDNMTGGGGRRAIIYMATAAPKDGTAITIPLANIAFDAVRGAMEGSVKPDEFGFIGRLSPSIDAEVTWYTSPTKTFDDAKQNETIVGSDGATSNGSTVVRVVNSLFGTKFQLIEGYKGAADIALAIQRGEVQAMIVSLQTVGTLYPDWLKDKKVNFLWQQATKRDPAFPDVPALVEFGTNDQEHVLLTMLASQGDIGKSVAAPPGTPAEVLAALRSAFDEMIQDPEFVADAAARKLPIDAASGETVQALIAGTMNSPPGAVAALAQILNKSVE